MCNHYILYSIALEGFIIYINVIAPYVSVCRLLFSLNIMFSRCIHINTQRYLIVFKCCAVTLCVNTHVQFIRPDAWSFLSWIFIVLGLRRRWCSSVGRTVNWELLTLFPASWSSLLPPNPTSHLPSPCPPQNSRLLLGLLFFSEISLCSFYMSGLYTLGSFLYPCGIFLTQPAQGQCCCCSAS